MFEARSWKRPRLDGWFAMRFVVFALLIISAQLVAELGAHIFRLWRYRSRLVLVFHVGVVVPILFGGGALVTADLGWSAPARYVAGACVGFLYEETNAILLRWFSFSEFGFLGLRSPHAIAAAVACVWGLYPLLLPIAYVAAGF